MLLQSGLILLMLNCLLSIPHETNALSVSEYNDRFSFWPSVHNAAKLIRLRREVQNVAPGPNEGGDVEILPKKIEPQVNITSQAAPVNKLEILNVPSIANSTLVKQNATDSLPAPSATIQAVNSNSTVNATAVTLVVLNSTVDTNSTLNEKTKLNLSNSGEVKRGLIVFAGFALMAVAYFVFYRRKSKNSDSGNAHSAIDANQFRYGVLQSEDRRDKMELSRVPLTMESDDDEDEDMEIFDLEQKKKSLSYVNLQTNDEDLVFAKENSPQNDRDNLLLDIEDGNSETLINWSSNSNNKSIL